MANHPNRGRVARALPEAVSVPKGPLGANMPLGRYVILMEDGTMHEGSQRCPTPEELVNGISGKKVSGWAQYDLASGKRLEVKVND